MKERVNANISAVARRAKEHGMSYGQYVAYLKERGEKA